jgi:prepilin-type N-terminal cleavage/methylation domain-containing protein
MTPHRNLLTEPRRALRRDDRGFSLIELLIASALFGVVITIVASVVISAINADRTVRDVTGSTTDGQLAVNVIEQTVRNSTAIQVAPVAGGDSITVRLRTTAGGAARCHAFFYDHTLGQILQRSSTTTIPLPTPGAASSEWTVVSGGIEPITGSGGTPEPVFAAQGTRGLAMSFTVDRESGPASLFVTAATGRGPLSNASPSCF